MACFEYTDDDVLGFAVDYTSLNVIVYIYLNGTLVETKTLPVTADTQEIIGAVTMGDNLDTNARVQIRTYPQAFKNDIPDGFDPLESPTGIVGWEFLSTGGYISHPDDLNPNRPYLDIIKSFPNFRRSTDVAFTGKTKQPFGDIVVHNEEGLRDDWLDRSWNGRDLRLYIGDRTWPRRDFRELMVGTSHELTSSDISTVSFKMRDKGIFLEKNIQDDTYTTGDSADQLKPLCLGECYNVEPVLTDAATHEYQVHDGAVGAITEVYDGGYPVASYTPDLANGKFTLGGAPSGIITADVQGATFSGLDGGAVAYYDTIGEIMNYIINEYSELDNTDVDGYNLWQFGEDNSESIGFYTKDAIKISQVFDELVRHLDGFWGFDRHGQFKVGKLIDPSTATAVGGEDTNPFFTGFEIKADDIVQNGIRIKSRNLPIYKATMGYKRYWRTLGASDVVGSVTTDEIADLKEEYRLSINERPATLTHHALAGETDVIGTVLADSTDADTHSLRHRELFADTRTTYTIEAFTAPFGVNLGDVISVDFDRFGFDGGVQCLVVGYSESVSPDRISIEVWK